MAFHYTQFSILICYAYIINILDVQINGLHCNVSMLSAHPVTALLCSLFSLHPSGFLPLTVHLFFISGHFVLFLYYIQESKTADTCHSLCLTYWHNLKLILFKKFSQIERAHRTCFAVHLHHLRPSILFIF